MRLLFGEEASGHLVLFALPGEIALWNEAGDLQGAAQQVARFLPSHNLYFCLSLQDHDAAIARWHKEHPGDGRLPTTRGYASTACAIPGAWADFDVQSAVHRGARLPSSKEVVLQFLKNKFPLYPSLIWDTGYGIRAASPVVVSRIVDL